MIIKGKSVKNRRFFGPHLLNRKENDQVRVIEFRGLAYEDVIGAMLDMEVMAKVTRCTNYMYHASLNPREDEHLTEAQWTRAVDTLERHLGFEEQPRFVIEHEKKGRVHRHVMWSRVDAETIKALPDSLTYRKHEAAAREIERDCGLKPVRSVLVKDRAGPRPERRARNFEGFRGAQTALSADQVRNEVTALWLNCDGGAAFKAALESKGYILCRGDRRDFCIVDPAGDEHSLARRIAGAKASDVRARMADIDPHGLPTVAQGRSLATAWREGSDAAHAVRSGEIRAEMSDYLEGARQGRDWDPQWHDGHSRREWSALEKAAHEYGKAVKDVARAGQDAYWQAFIGGKPRTDADKLADLMWGEKEFER